MLSSRLFVVFAFLPPACSPVFVVCGRYKPTAVDRRPSFIIPHQPRLDWQMWFAALGSYHGAPWLVHLADKVLEAAPDVLSLLDTSRWPWRSTNDAPVAPKVVRARLYHYDFTRAALPWAPPNHTKWEVRNGSDGDDEGGG